MLEEARSKLRVGLLLDMLDGDWHCQCPSKNIKHQPSGLPDVLHKPTNFQHRAVSTIIEALNQSKVSFPAGRIDQWGAVHQQESVFKPTTDSFRKRYRNTGRLCLQCARTGEDHGTHN